MRLDQRADRDAVAAALSLQGLTKRYGDATVVDALDLVVPIGSAVGFLGPNGAGKTTTMAMLLGLVRPSSGTAAVLGHPIEEPVRYLHRVGALVESPAFYPGLTGVENLQLLATMAGHDPARAHSLIERVGLAGRGDDRYRRYSMGMKQRLGIAAALLGDPELLVLDEPTNGLDPAGIHEVRTLVRSLADGHRTVFVSSHALREVEAVCDYLIVIGSGRALFAGRVDDFVAGDGDASVIVVPEHRCDLERLLGALRHAGRFVEPAADGARLTVRTDRSGAHATAAAVSRTAAELGCALVELRTTHVDLEARFLQLVGEDQG